MQLLAYFGLTQQGGALRSFSGTCRELKLSDCACREDLNVVVVLKALGMECEQEILDKVGPHPAIAALLSPTLQQCKDLGVANSEQALTYLGK